MKPPTRRAPEPTTVGVVGAAGVSGAVPSGTVGGTDPSIAGGATADPGDEQIFPPDPGAAAPTAWSAGVAVDSGGSFRDQLGVYCGVPAEGLDGDTGR